MRTLLALPRLKPSASALIVCDCQNGIVQGSSDDGQFLTGVGSAIVAARAAGVLVVYVRTAFRAGHPEVSPHNLAFSAVAENGQLLESSRQTQIDERISPVAGDVVITKRRVSSFSGTDLEVVLRARGIGRIVVAGVATGGVVLSTVRQAADLDLEVIVLADGVKDNDEEIQRVLLENVFPRQASVVTIAGWIDSLAAKQPDPQDLKDG